MTLLYLLICINSRIKIESKAEKCCCLLYWKPRRCEIEVKVLVTGRSPQGLVFLPFHFAEAAANILTLDARDPQAKIPDYKVCAVAVEKR